jgi:hypothetical protein
MGFEIYLQCFAVGQPSGIPRAAVRALFAIGEDSQRDYWSVQYGHADSCKIRVTGSESDQELVTSLCVYRPCGDIRFWESVLAILRMGPVMLYWPGGGPVVASPIETDEFPREMADSLGEQLCVGSTQEILNAIRAS